MVNESAKSKMTSDGRSAKAELARALEDDQFFLMYQPTIDLQTNAFAGVEALLRWRHPDRGVLGPESFLSDLETSGEIIRVGRWALVSACRQGAAWHDKGYRFAVSVNISSQQLASTTLALDVDAALSTSQFDPALLILEFSQKTLSDQGSAAIAQLTTLKALGVRLAVDDFAPGLSPLANLEKYPIDIVKLDRTFIGAITNSSESAALIHTLVLLAKSLHLQIIASGIEDAEQRKRLQIEAIDIGQGFHFSKPHEAEEIDRFLQDFAIFSGKPL